jgi:acyl dehydratase
MSYAKGDALPQRVFGPITRTDIVRYQGASGDFNPIHHDDDFAKSAGFPSVSRQTGGTAIKGWASFAV